MLKKIQWRAPESKETTFLFAGDFCPREQNSDYVAENAEKIVAPVKHIFENADIRLLQWETAVTEGGFPIVKDGPNLRCKESCLNFAKALNIDINLLANNHVGDYGPDAVNETLEHHRKANIMTVGAGKNLEDAQKPLFFDTPSGRVAIINVAENEFGIATEDEAGVAPLDPFENIELIKKVRKQADILIMTVHGGHEHNPFPSPRMTKTYRAFADAGADVVWNCHTHCMGGTEVYNNVPIIYSPGNFYFPMRVDGALSWRFGYLSKFYCDSKGCYAYEIIPYTFDFEAVRPLNEQEFEQVAKHYHDICNIIQDKKTLYKLFDAWSCGNAAHCYLAAVNRTYEENYPPEWEDPEVVRRWINVKNIFNCESHSDLMRNYTLLISKGKISEAKKYTPLLEKYTKFEYMQHLIDTDKNFK